MERQDNELKSGLYHLSSIILILWFICYCEVMYAPEIGVLGLDMARNGTREQIYSRRERKGFAECNWPSPWYPRLRKVFYHEICLYCA